MGARSRGHCTPCRRRRCCASRPPNPARPRLPHRDAAGPPHAASRPTAPLPASPPPPFPPGHDFPIMTVLALFGSFISYIYSGAGRASRILVTRVFMWCARWNQPVFSACIYSGVEVGNTLFQTLKFQALPSASSPAGAERVFSPCTQPPPLTHPPTPPTPPRPCSAAAEAEAERLGGQLRAWQLLHRAALVGGPGALPGSGWCC